MKIKPYIYGLASILFALNSCKTEDVKPISGSNASKVSITADKLVISENEGVATITASLNMPSADNVEVSLMFSGNASYAIDYTSSVSIIIPAGSITANITVTAMQDTIEEGNEIIQLEVASVIGATKDGIQAISMAIEDDDVPTQVSLLLNEILYDPSNSGLDGDANGDGQYSQAEDEFVELINLSTQAIDLSGYMLYDAENLGINTPNHTFPNGSIVEAGKAILIFGGGTPTGTFGGAVVQKSTSGDLNLNNAGDVLYLYNPANEEVLSIDIEPWSNNPNESYSRNPDITGDFEQHSASSSKLFSPGTKIDGTPF
jgi:hypothetical protein